MRIANSAQGTQVRWTTLAVFPFLGGVLVAREAGIGEGKPSDARLTRRYATMGPVWSPSRSKSRTREWQVKRDNDRLSTWSLSEESGHGDLMQGKKKGTKGEAGP